MLETSVVPGDDSTWFPNLYDDLTFRGADGTMYQTPSPLLKYDQIFGASARSYEAANSQNQDIQRWPGFLAAEDVEHAREIARQTAHVIDPRRLIVRASA